MKKALYIALPILVVILLVISAALFLSHKSDSEVSQNQTQNENTIQGSVDNDNNSTDVVGTQNPGENADSGQTGKPLTKGEILYSNSVDLNNDGLNEKIEIIKVISSSNVGKSEGILQITGKGRSEEVTYVTKADGLTGMFSSVEYQDIDGDGVKDVFIIIPDSGASFSLNYFFMYNYKTKRFFPNDGDISGLNLSEFSSEFKFTYLGNGLLNVKNQQYKFESKIDLKDNGNLSSDDALNTIYDKSWIDPTPVDLGGDSVLMLKKDKDNKTEIKLPLPIFGQATVDLIGEVDLFFSVDSNFNPVLKRFELLDYNGNNKAKAGEGKVN